MYHIQKKFRNEKRVKSGLLRGREFIMKDAYSFHADIKDFEVFYENAKKVYMCIFERLGLWADTVIADADGGAISDKNSHEFQTYLPVGEDIIVSDSSGYIYNLELASGIPDDKNSSEEEQALEYIDTVPDIVNMEKMTKYFGAPDWQMLKTVVYKLEKSQKYIAVAIRWDLDINELKLRKFLQKKYEESFSLAEESDLEKLGTVRGFISPLKESTLEMTTFWDESLKTVKNFFGGANALAKSTKNVNLDDLDISEFGDFSEPKEWFLSHNISWEKLTFKRASEVGNIFHLGTKYSAPFGLNFTDENNQVNNKVEMWCYGIGVSRLMGVMAEYFMTENGISWPEHIAPYDYYIIVIGEENISKAEELAKKIEAEGKSVILDDRVGRNYGFGKKAWDCELWGIPNRIVISPKTLEKGWYELKNRDGERIIAL